MRPALAPLLLLLVGCASGIEIAAGVTAGSIATIQRTPLDAVVSVVRGRDCSVVWLDRGESYCREQEPPPAPVPYCTRSRGSVDCWLAPPLAIPLPRGVADQPPGLTAAQEAHRTRRWPGLW